MRTIAKNIFQFSELSDAAKEKAREWYRSTDDGYYAEYIIEDAKRMAELIGIDIDNIYFSGFSCQGDGACFTGNYRYKKGAIRAIKSECFDPEIIHFATELQEIQKKYFYKLRAKISHSGMYYHEYSMNIDVEHYDDQYRDVCDAESDITDIFRKFAKWIYRNLESEYEYVNSDDVIAENMEVNCYEFYETGKPYA